MTASCSRNCTRYNLEMNPYPLRVHVPAGIFALQRASYTARRGMFPLHILATCPQVCVDLKSLYACDINFKFYIYINVNKLKTNTGDSEGPSPAYKHSILFLKEAFSCWLINSYILLAKREDRTRQILDRTYQAVWTEPSEVRAKKTVGRYSPVQSWASLINKKFMTRMKLFNNLQEWSCGIIRDNTQYLENIGTAMEHSRVITFGSCSVIP